MFSFQLKANISPTQRVLVQPLKLKAKSDLFNCRDRFKQLHVFLVAVDKICLIKAMLSVGKIDQNFKNLVGCSSCRRWPCLCLANKVFYTAL